MLRITLMNKKCTKKEIQLKKKQRAIRKGFVDEEKQNETLSAYAAGAY